MNRRITHFQHFRCFIFWIPIGSLPLSLWKDVGVTCSSLSQISELCQSVTEGSHSQQMRFTSKWYCFPFQKCIPYKVSRKTLEVHSSLGKSAEGLAAAGVYFKSHWHLQSSDIKKLLSTISAVVTFQGIEPHWNEGPATQESEFKAMLPGKCGDRKCCTRLCVTCITCRL